MKINKYIYKLNKEELFIVGFYISIIIIMLLAGALDFTIKNYIDVFFDILFAFLAFLGLIYFKYSKNVTIASHIIVIISTIGSYVFFITSGFSISVFLSIVSLSYFLLFPLRRALIYSLIHQAIIAIMYLYIYTNGLNNNYIVNNPVHIVATSIASLLMILLGVVYHLSVEESYRKLYQSNREKEILLKELNHRVKNNLQIILSIVQLQSFNSQEKDIFIELENRINAIAKTYEILIINKNLQEINMQEYIEKLISNIESSFLSINKEIDINIDANIILPLKEATYIGLIINELITNSYKYAFTNRKEGKIDIYFSEDCGNYRLIVKDNGVGFNQKDRNNSLGLDLVYSLVKEQLKGAIDCNSCNKTEYIIKF